MPIRHHASNEVCLIEVGDLERRPPGARREPMPLARQIEIWHRAGQPLDGVFKNHVAGREDDHALCLISKRRYAVSRHYLIRHSAVAAWTCKQQPLFEFFSHRV